jgi:DNA-binding transcriptional LysR family regulator
MINRNHLALFHAVAQEGGFGKAARRLRISQPAVSIQVAQLEETIGLKLFERSGRAVHLTEAGIELADYALRIAKLESEANQAMEDLIGLRRGRLRVGASTTIGAYLLPQILCRYRSRWPDIEISMEISNSAQIQNQVTDGLLDLGLVEGSQPEPPLQWQVFREDQLVPIVPWGHPILETKRPTLKSFLRHPLILREIGSGTRESIVAFLRERSLPWDETLHFGSTEAVKGAVAAGMGVSFVSSLVIPGDVMLKRFAVVPLVDAKSIRRPFYAVQAPGKNPSPAVAALLSIIKVR